MKNPPHPGGGLRYDIEAMGWTVAECAKRIGLPRTTLSRLLNGQQRITPAIALSLEQFGWSDADRHLDEAASHIRPCTGTPPTPSSLTLGNAARGSSRSRPSRTAPAGLCA